MQRKGILYFAGIFCFWAILFGYAFQSYAQDVGEIWGRVTAEDGEGIQDILINVYRQNPENPYSWIENPRLSSDDQGYYTATALGPGIYRLYFQSQNDEYYPEAYNNAPHIGSGTDVVVEAGQIVTGIDIELAISARVRGIVTDLDGVPLADKRVRALGDDFLSTISSAKTELDGSYQLSGLYTGTYHIYFDDPFSEGYAAEYYDNVKKRQRATPISLVAGQLVEGINAQLDSFAVITGTVTDPDGVPIANISVRGDRQSRSGNNWEQIRHAIKDARVDTL